MPIKLRKRSSKLAIKRPRLAFSAGGNIRQSSSDDEAFSSPMLADDPDITEQECTARARRLVINAAPEITRALVAQAKQGSYLHARMLFDFIALTAASANQQPGELSPIVRLLMDELQLEVPSQLAS